jgi:hypothetical protein
MRHTIEELIHRINTMHDLAVSLHRERNRYSKISGLEYDKDHCNHILEQIQQIAFLIANDRQGDEIRTEMDEWKNV